MMMLFEKDALIKEIREVYEHEYPTASGAFDDFVTRIIPNIINNQQTIDAVPVVRCKNCINRKHCEIIWRLDGDWYCADGERKEGEQDETKA